MHIKNHLHLLLCEVCFCEGLLYDGSCVALGVEVGQGALGALFRDVAFHLILGGCDNTAVPVRINEGFTEIKSQTPCQCHG